MQTDNYNLYRQDICASMVRIFFFFTEMPNSWLLKKFLGRRRRRRKRRSQHYQITLNITKTILDECIQHKYMLNFFFK